MVVIIRTPGPTSLSGLVKYTLQDVVSAWCKHAILCELYDPNDDFCGEMQEGHHRVTSLS